MHQRLPGLELKSVGYRSGQFNDVLILNEDLVARFPMTADAERSLAIEVAVLRRVHRVLPLPIPRPIVTEAEQTLQPTACMIYRMLPGTPLHQSTLNALRRTDPDAFEYLGRQAGAFLRALHNIPLDDLDGIVPVADDAPYWQRMLAAFQDELFGYMRPDARQAVATTFESYLREPDALRWPPVLRHGDFGGANLLFDSSRRQLSGVIDFGSVAIGDPATDLAAISAFDERLALAMRPVYRELFSPAAHRRAAFYRSTFALQQALWALRAGDADEFQDGIAAYI
ncbi:MAG TPA: phosphotransferase [Thermomicrobiales bacterium]|nr:phosphotransferase [Thermomicrobiales bacterium]